MWANWADSPDARAQALDRVFPESLLWKARKARPMLTDKKGRIAGAGSDPGPAEPYPPTGVLWGCPNMIFTQHSGGFSPERQIRHMGLLAENVRRYAHGLPLMNVVDKVRGY
jgi:hypothetical protein